MSELSEGQSVDRRAIPWERHVQSGIGALIVAMMLWVGTSIQSQSVAIAKLQVQVGETQAQIAALLTQQEQGVSAAQESGDVTRLQAQLDGIAHRTRDLEQAVARLQR